MWLTKNFIMEDFADKVKRGNYEKIDYLTWRQLKELPEHWDLNFEHYSDWCCATISWNGCNWPYEFDITDNSLGTYIYDLIGEYDTSISINSDTSSISNAFAKCAEAANKIKQSWSNIVVKGNTLLVNGKSLEDIINDATSVVLTRKENDNMSNLFKGFEFGSCEKDNVKVSIYGIAVKNASGTWVSYDPQTDSVVDVDVLNFDAKYLYKMPVAIKDIKIGDTIIHNRKPLFVTEVVDNRIIAIDPAAGEEKAVLPTKSLFNFDFVTKIVNLFDNFMGQASADQPFGNMLPFMMLADGASDMAPMTLAMMMQQGGTSANFNPLMLYALTSNKSNDNLLPLMLLSNPDFGLTPQTATKK